MAKEIAKPNKNMFQATNGYRTFMPNKGLLSEAQHKKLLKGESADLKGVPDKQMQYLVTNNLIQNKGE